MFIFLNIYFTNPPLPHLIHPFYFPCAPSPSEKAYSYTPVHGSRNSLPYADKKEANAKAQAKAKAPTQAPTQAKAQAYTLLLPTLDSTPSPPFPPSPAPPPLNKPEKTHLSRKCYVLYATDSSSLKRASLFSPSNFTTSMKSKRCSLSSPPNAPPSSEST